MGPTSPDFDQIPEICRRELEEWDQQIKRLGETLMGILCKGLGLETDRLKEMTCLEGRFLDQMGGLQVKHGEDWVEVKPLAGALVINIGDILQMISNDEYKSEEHRVVANSFREPRVSSAVFFNPSKREDIYGPVLELISLEKQALYKQFTLSVGVYEGISLKRFRWKASPIDHFKLW
ncbi:Oxoglutarate/iron-dependent dioxygenase [Macleaya cordata]|uniref:Oxoglutarate/iron-dependent dioxygenase n=1 Tax=Macleaya cordata TaxID=56857 RepID=A0A200QLA0_MACCD|nr:Oxoglutarate/iron-dependent dioxygenase [Macleaya cordata]